MRTLPQLALHTAFVALAAWMLVTVAPARVSRAEVVGHQDIVWDFTKPDEVTKLVRWTDEPHLGVTAEGLGWNGKAYEVRDITISSIQQQAVGWSWHAVTTVSVSAEVVPAGDFSFGENAVTFPSTTGTLYARYSPDTRHWSSWQALDARVPTNKQSPRLFLAGTVRVPERVRQPYKALLAEYAAAHQAPRLADSLPLVGVDEEAAVGWILAKHPDYFAQQLPLIGYIEFLWETQIRGDQRLRQLRIGLLYVRSGLIHGPAGRDEKTHWRFKDTQAKAE